MDKGGPGEYSLLNNYEELIEAQNLLLNGLRCLSWDKRRGQYNNGLTPGKGLENLLPAGDLSDEHYNNGQ